MLPANNRPTSKTILDQDVSDISGSGSRTLNPCDNSSSKTLTGESSPALELLGEKGVDAMSSLACTLISFNALEDSNTSIHGNVYESHTPERTVLLSQAKHTRSSMASETPLPCYRPVHPPSTHVPIASCKGCNFKDGQIFALVQILRMSHHGHSQN